MFGKWFYNFGGLAQIDAALVSLRRCSTGMLQRNKKFEIGDKVSIVKRFTAEDLKKFASLTGDVNPVHLDAEKPIVHGVLLNGIVSGVIGTQLPGPGTLVVAQSLHFPNKCYTNEDVKITVQLVENRKIMKVIFFCIVEKKIVLEGDAKLVFAK